jgi:hypothetical protein
VVVVPAVVVVVPPAGATHGEKLNNTATTPKMTIRGCGHTRRPRGRPMSAPNVLAGYGVLWPVKLTGLFIARNGGKAIRSPRAPGIT